MSEVKRFDHVNHAHVDDCAHIENPGGAWVKASDYDALAAEAQALREEVSALRARVVVTDPVQAFDKFFAESGQSKYRETAWWNFEAGFNLARLNGKTVSEWLLRQLLDSDGIDGIFDAQQNYAAHQELRALLNQDKENGNG
ncbi:TPA: hypothetical protein L4S58_000878 [Pseudomonas aeruginosa]|nr:hypothetical protein [Pseudomonas aeruginosa]HBP5518985.1 hypothetical protein [Pseudomonas aeruginosa]